MLLLRLENLVSVVAIADLVVVFCIVFVIMGVLVRRWRYFFYVLLA